MPAILFTNYASSLLAVGISDVATSVQVGAGEGALFPNPGASEYFFATLVDEDGNIEIVKCTSRATDVLTVVRAQEGTVGQAFLSAVTRVELRLTAGQTDEFLQATGDVMSGDLDMDNNEIIDAQLTGATVITGGTINNPALLVSSIDIEESGATANNGKWDIIAASDALAFRLANDAEDTFAAFVTVERTANVCDSITLSTLGLVVDPGASSASIRVQSAADAYIEIVADDDNSDETHNPWLKLSQDGGAVVGGLGLAGDNDFLPDGNALTGVIGNALILWQRATNDFQLFVADKQAMKAVRDAGVFLYHNNVSQLQTVDYGAAGQSSGIQIRDAAGTFRDVGYNTLPVIEQDASVNFGRAHTGKILHKDSGTPVFTCANDTNIPAEAIFMVANEAGGDMTIAEGSGVTLRWFDGAVVSTGDRTLTTGGVATVYRYTATEFWVWGSGLS